MNNTLFPLFCCQHMQHKSCTQFSFFQIIRQNAVNDSFQYPVFSTIILQLERQLSFKTAATRAMFSFIFAVRSLSLPLCIFNELLTHHKLATPSRYRSTQHGRVIKHFYKHFLCFCSCESHSTTKFYHRGTLFKIFFHGNF